MLSNRSWSGAIAPLHSGILMIRYLLQSAFDNIECRSPATLLCDVAVMPLIVHYKQLFIQGFMNFVGFYDSIVYNIHSTSWS